MIRDSDPFPLGARLDYVAHVATRQAHDLADGAALVIEIAGGPLSILRTGACFRLTAPGEPDQILGAGDLGTLMLGAALTHARVRATAGQAKGATSAKAT